MIECIERRERGIIRDCWWPRGEEQGSWKNEEKEMRHLHSLNWRVGTWKEQVIENGFFYTGELLSSNKDKYQTDTQS